MLQYPVRFIVAFGAGLLVAFAIPEAAYRFQLYQSLVVNAEYSIITTDTRAGFTGDTSLGGLFPPGRDVIMRQYRLDSSFGRQVRFHSNNLGWISRHDYAPDKEQGEFRIAIIGDSLTASITNDRPWVDVVQRELSGDGELLRAIGARKITVLNRGSPATGPVRMAQRSLPFAQRLNADMLIANFGIESLAFSMPAPVITDGKKLELRFGDVRVPIWCTRSFVTYDDCSPSRQWFVSPGVALGSEEVGNIKREIAETLLFQKLLRPTSFLLIPQDLADPPLPQGVPDQDQIPDAIRFFTEIKGAFPGLVVLVNPLQWYFDPVTRPAKIDQFLLQANQNGILAIDPLPRMPQASAEERSRWYNLPLDGHWSDAGAEIYGRVVAQIIRERLLAPAHAQNSASGG